MAFLYDLAHSFYDKRKARQDVYFNFNALLYFKIMLNSGRQYGNLKENFSGQREISSPAF